MAESRTLVKVFLASPGDLSEERKSAKLVVDEFNALLAEEFGYQVELVGWEDTVSVFGRPQATINRELERCELFVGLMWKHWGSPPGVSSTYTSGFEEEFKRSIERRLRAGRPEISLLFKEIAPEFLRDPGDELKKVLAFKNQLKAEKTILFENFSDIRNFETKFRRCITTYIRNLRTEEISKVSGQTQAPTTEGEKQLDSEVNSRTLETPLSVEGTKFLREFISKTERDAEQEPIEGVEIARFRLLSSIVKSQGNDDVSLGVHDANLIFAKGSHIKLGRPELNGLLVSGLDHYSHENVPLWRWLAAIDGFSKNILPIYAFFESSTERQVNALAAMRLILEPLPAESVLKRDLFLNYWFAKDTASALRSAALSYLGECGITSDLSIIREELDRNDNHTISAAADAFIRINLRESRDRAILALYDLQPTSISRVVLAALFDNEAPLSNDTLLSGVGHPNTDVRRIVVKLLRARCALPTDIAEQLLTDSDATVRCEALESLVDNGHLFTDKDAKKILIKLASNAGYGMLSGASDTAGEACWDHYRQKRLCSLTDKELEGVAGEDSIFDPDPRFLLDMRQFKRRGEDLRKAVNDKFKAVFAEHLQETIEKFATNADLIEKTRSLEDFIRKNLTRKGLDVICQKAETRDLGLVRNALKSGFIDYSAADVEYLRRFGEWEDIPLIIESIKRPVAGRSILFFSALDDSKYQIAARAIYALGRTRLPDLLTLPAPNKLLVHLIVEISDKAFRGLNDISITKLLRLDDDAVRRNAALKCVRSLPKKRVAKLLSDYTSGDEHRYYNVIHWLDFGISTPLDRALPAAEKVLNKEWSR